MKYKRLKIYDLFTLYYESYVSKHSIIAFNKKTQPITLFTIIRCQFIDPKLVLIDTVKNGHGYVTQDGLRKEDLKNIVFLRE
jgi:hypothetical protein